MSEMESRLYDKNHLSYHFSLLFSLTYSIKNRLLLHQRIFHLDSILIKTQVYFHVLAGSVTKWISQQQMSCKLFSIIIFTLGSQHNMFLREDCDFKVSLWKPKQQLELLCQTSFVNSLPSLKSYFLPCSQFRHF